MSRPRLSLRPIDADNLNAILALAVAPGQTHQVASNAVSLAEARVHPEAWYRAIYADETAVGFVMLEDSRRLQTPPADAYLAIWRLMIDACRQRRGYGGWAVEQLIRYARSHPEIKSLLVSCVPGPLSPEAFYRRFGFIPTGEILDGETVFRLPL
ncbi:MAG: GNAT family N-acetyltransferase [Thiobacillus sp.]|uniref:GNAT family N-acetyltransferase n=1 Tax=Thiobacillus sp. TaxID=924 RepID=UPI00273694AD|nr:GNAT family N-acetyltransferase [Thiobacillus sp.]MDP3586042.1 GNAT family N-acetyltransferase [Thiobacillus sp.]